MGFTEVCNLSMDIANLAFAKKEQKEKIYENIVLMVAAVCKTYESDEQFKSQMTEYTKAIYSKRGAEEKLKVLVPRVEKDIAESREKHRKLWNIK